MNQLYAITSRNLKLYLRSKGTVFFSLLSMLVVIMLMLFFLGDMNVKGLTGVLAELPGRDAAQDETDAGLFILAWTCAGIISINAVTVTLAAFSSMISDRENGCLNAVYTAPVSRITIAAGYVLAAWCASVIICTLTLAITEVYAVCCGMPPFSVYTHIRLFGMIMANSFTYASFMYLLATQIKSAGAWNGIGTVIGTLVGFLGGIYLPIGSLSEGIARIMKCTPAIYGAAMFRSVMTKDILARIFENAPEEMISEYRTAMGIDLTLFGHDLTLGAELMILLAVGTVFLLAGAAAMRSGAKRNRKGY